MNLSNKPAITCQHFSPTGLDVRISQPAPELKDAIKMSPLKVHYATFLMDCKQTKNRVLDARNSRLQELT